MKKMGLVILVVSFAGCTKNGPPQSITESAVGKSQDEVTDILKKNNIYTGVQSSKVDAGYEVIISADGQKFYLKRGQVVSSIRNAKRGERALVYWRQKFKGKLYHERPLHNQHAIHGHQKAWVELACDKMGTGVIFDPVRERVVKVFFYDRKK